MSSKDRPIMIHASRSPSDQGRASDGQVHDGEKSPDAAPVDYERAQESVGLPAEAVRSIWTRWALWVAFTGLFVMNFSMIFAAASAGVYDPYTTSRFSGHSLIATANIIHGIVRIVGYPLLAKVADHIGRPQGFAGAALSMALANALYAGCNNVETFLAGGIFESFGDTWWTITEQIFIAEVTSLVNRGFLFTLPESLAAIPTIYAGTYLGEHMLLRSSWRWGYGMWAAIIPFCALPTIFVMIIMKRRAQKQGLVYRRVGLRASANIPPGVSIWSKIYHIGWLQLDGPGAFLLLAGLSLTLLPLSITGRRNTERWSEPSSIVLIVVGVLTLGAFMLWDGRYARNPIIPLRMVKNPTVSLACLSVCVIAMSDATYRAFVTSFLQVAGGYSPGHAVRVDNARRIALNLGSLFTGLLLRFHKHTKPLIALGFTMLIIANGLPIYFTNIDGTHVASEAALTTGQVLLGLARGFAQVPLQVGLQAVVGSEDLGMATALFLSGSGLGANIGNSVSGALWNTILPRRLRANLPEVEQEHVTAIFRSIKVAQSYEVGTPVRVGIDASYRQTQQVLAIASVSISVPLLVVLYFVRNVRLGEVDRERQESGRQWLERANGEQMVASEGEPRESVIENGGGREQEKRCQA